jgi:hypothetical protein
MGRWLIYQDVGLILIISSASMIHDMNVSLTPWATGNAVISSASMIHDLNVSLIPWATGNAATSLKFLGIMGIIIHLVKLNLICKRIQMVQ